MIQFRGWYCNKRFSVADNRRGQRITCSCARLLRVPPQSGGNSRVRTPVDWLVETVVYGGGGGLPGCGLAVLILSQVRRVLLVESGWTLVIGLTLVGFLVGFLGGERGINWIGQMIRDREDG
jgi:hypothetical protein